MRSIKNIEQLVKEFNVTTNAEMDKKVREDVLGVIRRSKQTKPAGKRPEIWRIIMKTKITRLAVAGVIIIAVMIGLNHYTSSIDGAGVAWAEVAQRVAKVQAFMYRMHMTVQGGMGPSMLNVDTTKPIEIEITAIGSVRYGMKMETVMDDKVAQVMYMLPDEKVMVTLLPEMKKYIRIEGIDEDMMKKQKQQQDPRFMLDEFMKYEHVELGRDVIDGITVEGIEITDPRYGGGMFEEFVARLWVDVTDGWPVRMEMEVSMNDGQQKMHMVMDDYQWNIDIDPSEFELVIPDDYTKMATVQIPQMDIESTIQGLSTFAEVTGHYPEKLNIMTLIQEYQKAKREKQLSKSSLKELTQQILPVEVMDDDMSQEEIEALLERNRIALEHNEEIMKKLEIEQQRISAEAEDLLNGDKMQEMMNEMMPIQSLGMFYMKLVQEDKDPAYYGDIVTAEDVGSVLMRWKISEDEYRVIYGDLTAENVSAEQLEQLEAELPE